MSAIIVRFGPIIPLTATERQGSHDSSTVTVPFMIAPPVREHRDRYIAKVLEAFVAELAVHGEVIAGSDNRNNSYSIPGNQVAGSLVFTHTVGPETYGSVVVNRHNDHNVELAKQALVGALSAALNPLGQHHMNIEFLPGA